jgi:hypothetical protein
MQTDSIYERIARASKNLLADIPTQSLNEWIARTLKNLLTNIPTQASLRLEVRGGTDSTTVASLLKKLNAKVSSSRRMAKKGKKIETWNKV